MQRSGWFSASLMAVGMMLLPQEGKAIATEFRATTQTLMPVGQYYEATVPDTVDLAEQARLAVHGLTNMLDPGDKYSPYEHAFFNTQTPYMSRAFGPGRGCWSKLAEAAILARFMSGSNEYLEIQRDSLNNMLEWTPADGLSPMVRALSTGMSLNQQIPSPELEALNKQFMEILRTTVKKDGNMAWHFDWEPNFNDSKLGVIGWGWNVFIQGNALRAMSRYVDLNDATTYTQILDGLNNFLQQPKYWEPDGAPKAVVAHERAQFAGHHHSFSAALMGMLRYAETTGNMEAAQFVRAGYEFLRNFGIARIGMFGEMCTTGDMTFLAIKMSEMGLGDYWDDADSYVRNQLVELQITDADKMRRAVKAEPILARIDPTVADGIQRELSEVEKEYPLQPNDTDDNVIERNIGTYLSDSGTPTYIPKHRFLYTLCCTGNCVPALFFAWDATVRHEPGHAQINLLVNRASPWLDVDSYLPHQGKVVIHNKEAQMISVRIPAWVNMNAVSVAVNGAKANHSTLGRYMQIPSVAEGATVEISFPMKEYTETHTSNWGQHEFWMESTNPGHNWKPNPTEYTFHFRGNTLVKVEPEYKGDLYTLYQRDAMRSETAPMRKVNRFVSDTRIKW